MSAGAGSAAGSGFDLFNAGEGGPLSQELDLGESAAASAGAGASRSGKVLPAHRLAYSAPTTVTEIHAAYRRIFNNVLEALEADWEGSEAARLREQSFKSSSVPSRTQSASAAIGVSRPGRAVPIKGNNFRKLILEGNDPYKVILLDNIPFISEYIGRMVRTAGDDFMTGILNQIAQATRNRDDNTVLFLSTLYGVLSAAERDVEGMSKAELGEYRAMMAHNAKNAADLAVKALEAARARGLAGGAIYTLRAKRRNVRNKAQRRTRKGLFRQGSRAHRKTRRGSGARKPHGRRPKGL